MWGVRPDFSEWILGWFSTSLNAYELLLATYVSSRTDFPLQLEEQSWPTDKYIYLLKIHQKQTFQTNDFKCVVSINTSSRICLLRSDVKQLKEYRVQFHIVQEPVLLHNSSFSLADPVRTPPA